MLNAQRLWIRHGTGAVLRDASLAVGCGELHVVLGPNGAGKSTLLSALAGLARPTRGQVLLDGRPLAAYGRGALARRRAVLLQSEPTDLMLSVRDYVALGRWCWGDEQGVDEAIARAGCAPLADRAVCGLSGGEQARVRLARALAQLHGVADPVLLLDEPAAGLDPGWQVALLELLRRFADAGGAVLAVLHDPNQALWAADRVTLLAAGQVLATGPAREVLDAALLAQVYGTPMQRLQAGGRMALLPAPPRRDAAWPNAP